MESILTVARTLVCAAQKYDAGVDYSPNPRVRMYSGLSSLLKSLSIGPLQRFQQTGQSAVHRRGFTQLAPNQIRGKLLPRPMNIG
jgi:hypothetical protein